MYNFRVKKVKFTGYMKPTENGQLIPDFKVYLKGGFRSYKEDLEEARQEIAKEYHFNIEDVKTEEEWIQWTKDTLTRRAEEMAKQNKEDSSIEESIDTTEVTPQEENKVEE